MNKHAATARRDGGNFQNRQFVRYQTALPRATSISPLSKFALELETELRQLSNTRLERVLGVFERLAAGLGKGVVR